LFLSSSWPGSSVRNGATQRAFVMRGLDPRIHLLKKNVNRF